MPRLVSIRREGRVLVISMQREEKRNAVDRALADAIDEALNTLDDDDDLWAGVLTGTSTVFSAGSDLTSGGDYFTERGGEYGIIRRQRRKPLIAAVEGPALGGGLEIVLSCDLVVASTSARFGLPEVRIGLIPTCGALFRSPHALPLNLARELILTGEPIDAFRAYAAGFVNAITEPGNAETVGVEALEPDLRQRTAVGSGMLGRCKWPRWHARRGRLGGDQTGDGLSAEHPRQRRGYSRLLREATTSLDRTVSEENK